MFTAILFDLDNTLIDREAAFRSLIQASFQHWEELLDELVDLDRGGYGDRTRLFSKWHGFGGKKLTSLQFGLAISQFVRRQHDLLQSLCELSEATILAIISNGGVLTQQAKWRAAGLDSIVPEERLWISEAVGVQKPDPAIFHIACDALKVKPTNCLYVGDQPHIDIRGAKAAGLSTLLVTSPLKAGCVSRLHTLKNSSAEWNHEYQ